MRALCRAQEKYPPFSASRFRYSFYLSRYLDQETAKGPFRSSKFLYSID